MTLRSDTLRRLARRAASGAVACFIGLSCGGTRGPASGPSPPAENDAGADAARPPPPFAGSAVEATELISDAVRAKSDDIHECLRDYRTRKHLRRGEPVEVSMRVDREGHLIGVTVPNGEDDRALASCVQHALRSAVLPRTHAGVTVTRSFAELEWVVR